MVKFKDLKMKQFFSRVFKDVGTLKMATKNGRNDFWQKMAYDSVHILQATNLFPIWYRINAFYTQIRDGH